MSLLCDPCRNGHHSRCAGEPTFALMCRCHWCKRWSDTHGPFGVPEDTRPDPDNRSTDDD